MRRALALVCLLASCGGEPPTPAPPSITCTNLPPIGAPVRRAGAQLLLDTTPFRALGTNIYYLQQLFAYEQQGNAAAGTTARAALDDAACLGLNVVRTWAFNDSQDASSIRRAPGLFDENNLRALDRAVSEASARGLRVILSLVNNWDDYGGLRAYAAWANTPDRDRFFHDPEVRQPWKDYASLLLSRINTVSRIAYRDDPAILAWEIGNELRCPSCAGTTRWAEVIRELAAHLRAAGATQLIADGGDGFDQPGPAYQALSNGYVTSGAEGTSFSALLAAPELDLVSYHAYPDRVGLNAADDMRVWIDAHEEAARRADHVAYLGEFGFKAPDAERARVFSAWLDRGPTLALLWQLLPPQRRPDADDGYGVVMTLDPLSAALLRARAHPLP